MKSATASKLAPLRRYAPNTQALADVPARPPKRRPVEDTGLHVTVARDATGGDWALVNRQLEWRMTFRQLMAGQEHATRAFLGLPN